jgi:hypothetical protein
MFSRSGRDSRSSGPPMPGATRRMGRSRRMTEASSGKMPTMLERRLKLPCQARELSCDGSQAQPLQRHLPNDRPPAGRRYLSKESMAPHRPTPGGKRRTERHRTSGCVSSATEAKGHRPTSTTPRTRSGQIRAGGRGTVRCSAGASTAARCLGKEEWRFRWGHPRRAHRSASPAPLTHRSRRPAWRIDNLKWPRGPSFALWASTRRAAGSCRAQRVEGHRRVGRPLPHLDQRSPYGCVAGRR